SRPRSMTPTWAASSTATRPRTSSRSDPAHDRPMKRVVHAHLKGIMAVPTWLGEDDRTADDLAAGAEAAAPSATTWLTNHLRSGPVETQQTKRAAQDAGISQKRLEKARQWLRVVTDRGPATNTYTWRLP